MSTDNSLKSTIETVSLLNTSVDAVSSTGLNDSLSAKYIGQATSIFHHLVPEAIPFLICLQPHYRYSCRWYNNTSALPDTTST